MQAMVQTMRKPVRVTWVRNILEPVNSKQDYTFPYLGNGSIADYIPADVPVTDQTVVRQNGHFIPRERWNNRGVMPGDEIYIGCVPAGIGALIIGSAAAIGAKTATTLGVIGAIAIDLALSTGLSFLASMLTDQPGQPDAVDSSTYSGGGRITTRSQAGAVIPDVYGEHIVGGNVIASYTGHTAGRPQGRGTHSISFGGARHNVVLGLCTGPINAVGGITTDVSCQHFASDTQAMTVYSRLGNTSLVDAKIGTVAGSAKDIIRLDLKAGNRYIIRNITLTLKRSGVLTGETLTIGLYGGAPSGTWLAEPYKLDCALVPNAYKDVSFELPEPVELEPTSDTTYWLMIEPSYSYSTTNYISLGTVSGYVSTHGAVYYYDSVTPQWVNTLHMASAFVGSQATPYIGTDENIKVNGTAVENYAQSGYISTRLGSLWQEELPGTTAVAVETVVDQDLPTTTTHWVEQTTSAEVNAIGIVINFPGGIYYTNSTGKREGNTVALNIKWRVTGTTEWLGFAHVKEELFSESPENLTVYIPFPTEQNSQNHQFRNSILDIAVQRVTTNAHTVNWASLQEYNDDQAQTYPYTALLQLDTDIGSAQGPIDSITTRIQGHKVFEYDTNGLSTYTYSDNPAWCTLHYLLNRVSGGGNRLNTSNVDMDSFVEWASYCAESISDGNGGGMNRWATGLVIDSEKSFWDWAKQLAAVGRCKLIRSGGVIRAKIEKAEDPVQMFTAGNTVAGTFKLQYVNPAKRPNAVDVKFLDSALDFAENIASAEDRSLRAAGEPDIRETVELYGCTHLLRAKRHAKYLLNVAKYTNWVVEFQAFIDAVACEPGDVIAISNDAINWEAVGGRLKENAPGSNSIKLDRDLVIDGSGDEYKVTVRSVNSGQDILQTSTIIEGPGTYSAGDTIDVSPSWTTVPQAGDVYSVMPIRNDADARHDRGAKLARITSMHITDEFFVRIQAMQYDERVYHDDPGVVNVPAKTQPMDGRMIPPRVQNLVARPVAMGNGVGISITWSKMSWPYPYPCKLWFRPHGAPRFTSADTTITHGTQFTFPDVLVNTVWDVAVCPCAPWDYNRHRNPQIEAQTTVKVSEPAWNTAYNTVTGLSY